MPRLMLICALFMVASLNAGELPRLGSLSEKYESGNRGPGTVSSGVGDPGGVSYGTYQLSSKLGRADQFVAKYFPDEFKGLKAGTDEFTKRWKQLAKEQTEKLREKEHYYIQVTHYDPQVAHLKKALMLDVNERSRALQNAVWSTAVQHGPNAKMIDRALAPLLYCKRSTPSVAARTSRGCWFISRGQAPPCRRGWRGDSKASCATPSRRWTRRRKRSRKSDAQLQSKRNRVTVDSNR
jgi:hypothetical protein